MRKLFGFCLILFSCVQIFGAEGFWTPENFPFTAYNKSRTEASSSLNHNPVSREFLQNILSSTFLLNESCSAFFISNDGLALTNRHCLDKCLENAQKAGLLGPDGVFVAKATSQEFSCSLATADIVLNNESPNKSDNNQCFRSNNENATSDFCRKVKTQSHDTLIHYRRYYDVRLVFAPEISLARYGGEDFNFKFPRYSLDAALIRVYQGSKALNNQYFFKPANQSFSAEDPVFVAGVPATSRRAMSSEESIFMRDVKLPTDLRFFQQQKVFLQSQLTDSSESKDFIISLDNTIEVLTAELASLNLHKYISTHKKLHLLYKKYGLNYKKTFLVTHFAMNSKIYAWTKTLVRLAYEKTLPVHKQSFLFRNENLELVVRRLNSDLNYSTDEEKLVLQNSLNQLLKQDKKFSTQFKNIFNTSVPASSFTSKLVESTDLAKNSPRQKLLSLSWQELQKQNAVIIQLSIILEKRRQELVQEQKNIDFQISSLSSPHPELPYDEADQTPRISYGRILAPQDFASAFTYIGDIYSKGLSPLPTDWLKFKKNLNLNSPLNFATTADTTGGSSGSAVVDEKGRLIGIIFDANDTGRDSELFYNESTDRSIALSTSALHEILKKVYQLNYLDADNRN